MIKVAVGGIWKFAVVVLFVFTAQHGDALYLPEHSGGVVSVPSTALEPGVLHCYTVVNPLGLPVQQCKIVRG